MSQSILILFIAFAGFFLAAYLFHKKRRKHEPFICPLRANCSEVIQSDYSKFLGVPVEIVGLAYYASIAVFHGLVLMMPSLDWLNPFLLIASSAALLFSAYLTAIQVVALKKFCTWCLLSASFCLMIFVLSVWGSLETVRPFLMAQRELFANLHILIMGIGAGTATMTTLFFYQFFKDGRLSEEERGVLSLLFEFGWLSLCLLLISGSGFYLSEADWVLHTSAWLFECLAIVVVIGITALLTLRVLPRLAKISLGEPHDHVPGELLQARSIVFTFGPIALVSWYAALLFGLGVLTLSFAQLAGWYVGLLCAAVAIGRWAHQRVSRVT